MINLADDLAEHGGGGGWGGSASVFSISWGFLTGWPSYLPSGRDPKLALPGFCLVSSQEGEFSFSFFCSFLSFFFLFFGPESQPHLRLSVSVFNHLGPHSLGVHPGYSTDAEQDLRRSEVGRARKTSSGWSGRINHLLYPFFFFCLFSFLFFFLPLSSCLPGRCHQTGQMTPETRKLHAPRFLEKVSAHVCAWYEGLFGNGERWYRRESGGVASTAWWGGGLCESYVQTEEHRCISPWNPNPPMHRRTTAFINNIQTQLSWLEKQ